MFVACLPRSVGRAGRPHPGHRRSTSWLRPPHRTDCFAHGGAGADVLIGVFWYCRGPPPSAARESRTLRSPGLSAYAQSSAEAGRLGMSPSFGASPTTSCCLRPAGSPVLRGVAECREPQRSARPAHDQRLPSFLNSWLWRGFCGRLLPARSTGAPACLLWPGVRACASSCGGSPYGARSPAYLLPPGSPDVLSTAPSRGSSR